MGLPGGKAKRQDSSNRSVPRHGLIIVRACAVPHFGVRAGVSEEDGWLKGQEERVAVDRAEALTGAVEG